MRNRKAMLKDAAEAHKGYAWLSTSAGMLVIRLGQDMTELLAVMAEIEPFGPAELLEDQMRKLENERAGTMVEATFNTDDQPPIDDDDLPF